jgi:hypothetical protein
VKHPHSNAPLLPQTGSVQHAVHKSEAGGRCLCDYDFVALQRRPEHAQQKIAEEFTPTGSGARAAALLTQQ